MGSLELDTTERLHFHFSLSRIGEGNGNPLQCSYLENPSDGEPGGLLSMGSHRVRHDWRDLAAAVAQTVFIFYVASYRHSFLFHLSVHSSSEADLNRSISVWKRDAKRELWWPQVCFPASSTVPVDTGESASSWKEVYLAVISFDVSCGGKLPDVMCDNTGFDSLKCY